ncbi:MAG: hypothetical protein CV089_06470 [Nitrospira sp. WS110]|nr:hypothetical protein [Nitrospira sp. WS110]
MNPDVQQLTCRCTCLQFAFALCGYEFTSRPLRKREAHGKIDLDFPATGTKLCRENFTHSTNSAISHIHNHQFSRSKGGGVLMATKKAAKKPAKKAAKKPVKKKK